MPKGNKTCTSPIYFFKNFVPFEDSGISYFAGGSTQSLQSLPTCQRGSMLGRLLRPQAGINYDVVVAVQLVGVLTCMVLLFIHFASQPKNNILSPSQRKLVFGALLSEEEGGDEKGEEGVAQGWFLVFLPFLVTAPWQLYVRQQWQKEKDSRTKKKKVK